MSFHVKDDFKAGAPISQVPASWFNTVGKFLNGLVGGFGVKTAKHDSGGATVSLDKQVLQAEIGNAVEGLRTSKETRTPTDCKDSPITYDSTGSTLIWTAGGENGFELDCYCKIAPQTEVSNYSVFQRCRMTFSKDGLLVKGELLAGRVRIQAKNA